MHRINTTTATIANLFTDGNAANGDPPTELNASFFNDLQEEICNLIEAQGIVLAEGTQNQLMSAIWRAIATANRPAAPVAGQACFDTTLGKPIWYDGVNWVDATGAVV